MGWIKNLTKLKTCGVVFMMVGRVSPNMWPYWWVMALVFFFGMISGLEITHLKGSILSCMLESTDAAPEVPHPRPTRLPARWTTSALFFSSDSRRLGSICADAAQFVPNRLWFTPNRADSAKIGPYRPYRALSAGGRYGRNRPENGRNRPKHAGNGRNRLWIWPEKPKLAFFFLYLWIKA